MKIVIFVIGISFLGLCILGLPLVSNELAEHYPAYMLFPALMSISLTIIPFFISLYQALKLLDYIDDNNFFSDLSINAFKSIKYSALVFSVLYIIALPFLYLIAQFDDAPGILLIGCIITSISILVTVIASLFQKLLEKTNNPKLV